MLVFGLGYAVGGAALGARRRGEPLKRGPAMFTAHPHYASWMQLHGLVQDGVNFSQARMKGGSHAAVSRQAPAAGGEEQDERQSSGGKGKRGSKEPKPKGANAARGKKSAKSSKAGKGAAAGGAEAAAEETVAEANERLLQEERSAGVHSSQQAIKVVGLG